MKLKRTDSSRAVASLERTSVPTGRLGVPELDLHTVSDQLVPVQQENFYAERVAAAGSRDLLRQAYVASVGHCNPRVIEAYLGRGTTSATEEAAVAQPLSDGSTATT